MGFDPHEPEQSRRLRKALKAADLSTGELWLNYFSLGGSVGEYEVEAYLQGLLSIPVIERDLLAMACNELIDKAPRIHAPYSDDLMGAREPQSGGTDEIGSNEELSQSANERLSQPTTDPGAGEEEPGQERFP